MDLEVKWSPEATEDLESIAEYNARDSEFYARAVVTEILAAPRTIREFPLIGHVVPEIGDEQIRERLVYSYRIPDRAQANSIHSGNSWEKATGEYFREI
jgi:plasmid stabilization system protein ParE